MRILHLDEQRGWRGGEQQASWLMRGLVARGHTVFAAGRAGSRFLQDDHGGATRIALPLRGEWDLLSAWRLSRIVQANDVDIVHAHTSHAHGIACIARTFSDRARVVVSRRVDFAPKRDLLNRWKYRAPDLFLSVSQRVDEVLAAHGIPAARRVVVHSAVDLARLDVPPLPRAALGVPEDAPLVVSAGALVGHKDIENLVEAFGKVKAQTPAARLVVAGEGERRPTIEERIRALGLQDAVTLLGHRDDAPRLIRAGDVYVSSSWSEGLGTSILEALACGTPVVACEAGGAREMVVPGQTGWLVPPRDANALAAAIIESLNHRGQAREMAANGRRLVERQFMVERMVEQTIAAYGRVLEE